MNKEIAKKFILQNFSATKENQNSKKISLGYPSYGWEEVYEALESMLEMKTTMGKKVKEFEKLFAKYIGVKYALMVNSGSSANLLALSILSNPILKDKRIKENDEIITPAITWSTTVFPIINIHAMLTCTICFFNMAFRNTVKAKQQVIPLMFLFTFFNASC